MNAQLYLKDKYYLTIQIIIHLLNHHTLLVKEVDLKKQLKHIKLTHQHVRRLKYKITKSKNYFRL